MLAGLAWGDATALNVGVSGAVDMAPLLSSLLPFPC